MKSHRHIGVAASLLLAATAASAQQDPIIQRIYKLGTDSSGTYELMQSLSDSIGPRLTGSPGLKNGNDWLVKTYQSWGVSARNEQYGTWKGWRRGTTHVDLIQPRVRTLEGMMLAWSPGTGGRTVTAPVVILPEFRDSTEFVRWLPEVRDKFVLVSFPQPTCRGNESWEQWKDSTWIANMMRERMAASQAWTRRVSATGYAARSIGRRLEAAGAAGIIASNWSNGWGVNKVFNTTNERAPALDLSCEDYGLVFRMAEQKQNPVLRVTADAEFLGEVPVHNTIAQIRGSQRPDEYIMLSAHFDSWDAGSGTTDNATGTVVMLEAIRILRKVYPNPKRTILVGHWGGEEQGLIGSRAFAADHPEVVEGLHALFNQDNGTGRIGSIGGQGLAAAERYFTNWLSKMPPQFTQNLRTQFPGAPGGGGSDYASFICYGAPAFGLSSINFDYSQYTWHTNRDTFDKTVWDDLKHNATMVAMLVYLADQDAQKMPRERAALQPDPRTNQPRSWPQCSEPQRTSERYFR